MWSNEKQITNVGGWVGGWVGGGEEFLREAI